MYTIVAQTPKMARQLESMFARKDRERAKAVKVARKAANGARFVVVDAGFPRLLWLVWDCEANDNVRGFARHPWLTTKAAARKIADRMNAASLTSAEG